MKMIMRHNFVPDALRSKILHQNQRESRQRPNRELDSNSWNWGPWWSVSSRRSGIEYYESYSWGGYVQ